MKITTKKLQGSQSRSLCIINGASDSLLHNILTSHKKIPLEMLTEASKYEKQQYNHLSGLFSSSSDILFTQLPIELWGLVIQSSKTAIQNKNLINTNVAIFPFIKIPTILLIDCWFYIILDPSNSLRWIFIVFP